MRSRLPVRLAPLVLAPLALGAATALAFDAPGYDGPPSDHFDGERFHNLVPVPLKGFADVWRWRLQRSPAEWPERIEVEPGPPPPIRVGPGELRVTFIGHATVLVQVDGVNILTDPIYSERASPFGWAGPKRVRAPGIRFDDLPPIDAVLVSHNHYDHLDIESLRRLHEVYRPRILAGLGTAALLADEEIGGAVDLDWWRSVELTSTVRVTAVPVQHWSRRGLFDAGNTLWAGFVIEASGGPVYFAGDTGWGPHFELTYERFGPMRLALLPIGSYLPRWFMRAVHISSTEAVDAHRVLRAQRSVAIHFGTFELGDDGPEQGPKEARAYLALHPDLAGTFWILGFGEGRDVPPLALDAEAPAAEAARSISAEAEASSR